MCDQRETAEPPARISAVSAQSTPEREGFGPRRHPRDGFLGPGSAPCRRRPGAYSSLSVGGGSASNPSLRSVFELRRERDSVLVAILVMASSDPAPPPVGAVLAPIPPYRSAGAPLRIPLSDRYLNSGERGIRTLGTLTGLTVFETARFNRSRISPKWR